MVLFNLMVVPDRTSVKPAADSLVLLYCPNVTTKLAIASTITVAIAPALVGCLVSTMVQQLDVKGVATPDLSHSARSGRVHGSYRMVVGINCGINHCVSVSLPSL